MGDVIRAQKHPQPPRNRMTTRRPKKKLRGMGDAVLDTLVRRHSPLTAVRPEMQG